MEEKLDEQDIFKQVELLCDNSAELKKLIKFTDNFIRIYEWATGLALPKDYEAEDVVAIVMTKNLDGSRGKTFDSSKGSFSSWLKRQIESEIRNKISWDRSKSEVPMPVDEHGEYNEEQLEHRADNYGITDGYRLDTPESILISEEEAEARWDHLYECADGDEELEKIVEAIENGCDLKPRNLAQELNWSVDRVNNAKKRLLRRVLGSNIRRTP